ncbi:alpha/beta fold hydrolase [Tsuneonella amylolytica]|uniref:alpha/beta fold hydrolase n=1 Tax=Tsuneonella amylolytica TaxID=2338327 RepID=UPI000EA85F59|nr:alpha/beta hydrolase [Tsuneonella amylolytica]
MADSEYVTDGSLLGRFGGEKPPAAPWLDAVLAMEPDRTFFEVDGARIELLTWGEVGNPGMLFLHGNAAHADWWSFIAPFFAADYRCAAISWSGMGRSDWREQYAIATFGKEILSAIDAAELAESGTPPAIVAHSFGGFPTLYVCAEHPDAITGAILVDSAPPKRGGGPPPRLAEGRPEHNRYPTLADGLHRFRFLPEQESGRPELIDHIARGALEELPATADQPAGWSWRFDPRFWSKFDRGDLAEGLVARARAPIGIIYGAHSAIMTPDRVAEMKAAIPDLRFATALPDAAHHVMVDDPLGLIDAIREGLPKLA